jgi:hypothetical protein
MRRSFGGKVVLSMAMVLMLVACVPVCQARSGSKAEKHAQKMQKKLSKYKPGTLLHLEFNDDTECTGKLLNLSEASFTFNNTETNAKETHNYSDVTQVEKDKQYIGQGSAPKKRHIHIF